MRAGQGCNDPRLTRILTYEAIDAANDLEGWGIEFVKDPNTGKALVAMGDFASRPRNRKIYHHGKPITQVLDKQLRLMGVTIIEGVAALGLLRDGDGVAGVLGMNSKGERVAVKGGATVLAAGGAGQLFNLSLMPPDITGDGYAFGYRAGATMVNMEFMQAGFGTIRPALNIILPWFWGLLPEFTDGAGHDLLAAALPGGVAASDVMKTKVKHYPFSTSDNSKWLEVAAKRAMENGQVNASGGFQLDLRKVDESLFHLTSDLAVMWAISKPWMKRKHMDVEQEPLEIGLFGHSINGGMVITGDCETTIPGLFAVGETAAGPYGADRLGGNMLLTCQVFGKRAGRRAAEVARSRVSRRTPELPRIDYLEKSQGHREAREATRRVKDTMTRNVLIIRSEDRLRRALDDLETLRAEVNGGEFKFETPRQILELTQAMNLIDVGEAMVAAARLRTETRGSHYREDYPSTDVQWDCPIAVHCVDGRSVAKPYSYAA